jgi:cytosine/adenosine deaminase-related metal-dependent hydrolase
VFAGTLLACAEAISSGVTTVHDWAHNVRGPDHAEAGRRALARAGLRARFSYGYPAAHRGDQAMDLAGLRRHAEWNGRAAGGLLPLGVACRIVVSPEGLNLGVLTDPVQLLVTAAQPENVDTVIADGRVLKQGGTLATLDAARTGRDARQPLAGVLTRARSVRR